MHIKFDEHTKSGWIIEIKKWLIDHTDMPHYRGQHAWTREYKTRLQTAARKVPREQRHSSTHHGFQGQLPPQIRS